MFVVETDSPEETFRWGEFLGQAAQTGLVVCLSGELGAGKTQFAKGVARGLEIRDYVTSPTFNLINEYQGRLPLYHMDLYRLSGDDEVFELGIEEYLFGQGVCLIEWPDRLGELIPPTRLDLTLEDLGENRRQLKFQPQGVSLAGLIEELSSHVHFRS